MKSFVRRLGTVWWVPPVSTARISLPDRYRVVRHVANGGMASVWEAHDELLDRSVAVKLLASHLSEDERARRRFQREARAAAGLSSHPNVATIYDVGEHEGRTFMVMELLTGGTVADQIRGDKEISHPTALRWLREAASALDAAHAADVVHRDVKPANMLLDERGRLAIGDFGIARLALEDQLTATGTVLGTAAYISPEQAVGDPATAASDRYALAVVAFELLTGERPFQAENFAAQARAHVEDPPPGRELGDLPRDVDRVLSRALAKDPGDRYATASEFVDELDRALSAPKTASTRLIAGLPRAEGPGDEQPAGRRRRAAAAPVRRRCAARRARGSAARRRDRIPAALGRWFRRRLAERRHGEAQAHGDAEGHPGADPDGGTTPSPTATPTATATAQAPGRRRR